MEAAAPMAYQKFPSEWKAPDTVKRFVADLNSPPIGSVRRIADLVERLKMEASETDAGDWVIGMGYDDSLIEERRHPTRIDLDAVSDSHPVVVIHVSGHLAVANSAALAELGAPYFSSTQGQRKPLSPAFRQTSLETIPSSCHLS